MKFKLIYIFLISCFSFSGHSQQTPAPEQSKDIIITGATAHIGNGDVLKNSVILISEGKIKAIEKVGNLTYDANTTRVIDAQGQHVYPGFIIPNSTLGLVEVDAVKASDDQSELGTYNPHIRSLIAYNAESKVVESMRPNGVLLGQITPRGGRISGTSSIVQFDAWNWEDAAIKTDDGIHMNWPNTFSRGRWWLGEDPALKPNPNYEKQVRELKDFFTNAKNYNPKSNELKHLPYAAMKGLFNTGKKLYIDADDEKSIVDAVSFARSFGITNITIVGGYEAHKITDFLKDHNVSVLLQRVHSRPDKEDDDYDISFKLAKLLTDEGVLIALEPSGQMERMNSRNLPFYAGTTAAYGLDREKALQLITLNTAKILGIDKSYGSLEAGKSATLFISKGDALDMRTNHVTQAFIDGRDISLETHQTELWKRYAKKYDID